MRKVGIDKLPVKGVKYRAWVMYPKSGTTILYLAIAYRGGRGKNPGHIVCARADLTENECTALLDRYDISEVVDGVVGDESKAGLLATISAFGWELPDLHVDLHDDL